MSCPTLADLPPSPPGKTGWPWTEESPQLPDTMPDGSPWPRVSIVTPSYNQGQFIEETIRSVLLQGYPKLEYIIIDGGSTDNSVEIIGKYEEWLTHWVSEKDRGQAHAINKGWLAASGQYITWLNSDDLLLPQSLKWTVSELETHDGVAFAYGDICIIEKDSRPRLEPYNRVRGRASCLEDMIIRWWNPVRQQGFLMRRSVLESVGFLDESFQFTMDFEYWIRLALAGVSSIYIPQLLAAFRQHEQSKSNTIQLRRIEERYKIHDMVFSDRPPPETGDRACESIANLHLNAAYIAYTAGKAGHMRRYALQQISQLGLKSSPRAWLFLFMSLLGNRGIVAVRHLWRAFRRAHARSLIVRHC